jgi:hypothetical protein
MGRDPKVLSLMLAFYAPEASVIVDVTANARRMWDGLDTSRVTFCDSDPTVHPDVVANFSSLPMDNESVDVLVFDPPHLPSAAGSEESYEAMVTDYGLAHAPTADNVAGLFPGFLVEAQRVLRKNGIVIAKIKDYVHNHSYQWMLSEFIGAARSAGLTPCDLIIKCDPCGGNLSSGRWQKAYHARNIHCWFVVIRKGKCEP